MVKGLYSYLSDAWKKPGRALLYEKMIAWRAGQSIEKVDKPLRLDRARALGYKAKKGFVMLRVRIKRGGRKRRRVHVKGRKSRKQSPKKILKMSYRWVAEIRAARRYKNLEVLNSYWIGKDGKHYFFEVIMVDPSRPEIKKDPVMKWITDKKNRKRAERGLTGAAKKSRGLKDKSPNKKVRPSIGSWGGKGK